MIRIVILFFVLLLNSGIYSQGYICAVGGGSENYNNWSDAPYGWVVQKSDSGKIIIIGTSSSVTNWLPDYFILLGADTAYNLVISSTSAANLQQNYDDLISAKAIFIRGGDQWNYIRYWKGTKTDSAINYVFSNGGVIAGTSAGEAVLGDVDFSARLGSAYPDQSLVNPYTSTLQFEDQFLNFVPDVIFDSHFIERGRHGRLIAMLYNRYYETGRALTGVGIDDRTALCIYPDGTSEVMGSGAVSFFNIDDETVLHPMDGVNYTIEKLKCDQLTRGWKYDLVNKQISFIPPSAKEVDASRTWQMPETDIWITGSENIPLHLQSNFPSFISNNKLVIISHPGAASRVSLITTFLDQQLIEHAAVYLSAANLNEPDIASLISDAEGFVVAGDSLDILSLLRDTSTLSGMAFKNSIVNGTPLFCFGKGGKISGSYYIDNLYTDIYASYRGKMTNHSGVGIFGDLLFETSVYDNNDYYENKVSSVLWGMMLNRKRLGVYLHGDAMIHIKSSDSTIKGFGSVPPVYADASRTTYVDSSTYRAGSSIGTRQVVAMNNLRYSITTSDIKTYSIGEGKFSDDASSVEDGYGIIIKPFILYQNYPNPFNPETTLKWHLKEGGRLLLKIYDILGNVICEPVNEYRAPGSGETKINTSSLGISSGIYFYRLSINNHSETKPMLLLK
jgi:cyanophycinase